MTGPRFSFRLPPEPPHGLTPADWDVLHLMALGMSDKMTAAVRGTSRQTVKNHMSGILRKLDVGNRVGALRVVGWLHVPENLIIESPPRPLKTHCLRGHPLAGANLYGHPGGKRQCRACRALIDRRRYRGDRVRKRAA